MMVQKENESRIEYLIRVLDYAMNDAVTSCDYLRYDDTTCDHVCLFEDIESELIDLGVIKDRLYED